jgi:diaminopimelate decarboxylase
MQHLLTRREHIMDHFNYQQDQLYAEDVSLSALAKQFGTPLYVYSRATIERHFKAYQNALGKQPNLICYAVKANSNLAVLNLLSRLGSGFDVVSQGELERVIAAGGDPAKVVFSGVGKKPEEMERALQCGIYCFNVESASELHTLNRVAQHTNVQAPVSLRVNPDVDAKTHPYIATGLKENKFGIAYDEAVPLYLQARGMTGLSLQGIDCHIGSQLTELDPYLEALQRLLKLIDTLKEHDIHLKHLDMGGGLGVTYQDETPPHPDDLAAALVEALHGRDLTLLLEPGRSILGNAGVLVTEVIGLKHHEHKDFAIVDAAMNDLLRPALYQAEQAIWPLAKNSEGVTKHYDIVGPVCETADFLGKDRKLSLKPGDLLAIRTAGAYGFCMSSNYNSRPRAAEIMVDGSQFVEVRQRETFEDLYRGECVLPM